MLTTLLALSSSVSLTYVSNSFAAEWCAVRGGLAPAAYAQAVDAAKQVPEGRSGRLAMTVTDALACTSRDDTEFLATLAKFKERPGFADACALASTVVGEIDKVPAADREKFASDYRSSATVAQRKVESQLKKFPGLLPSIAADLGMSFDQAKVKVLLVPAAPAPGAVTFRTSDGPLCLVGVGDFKDSELLEAVVHEATHAMDELSKGHDTLLDKLRKALADAGLKADDPLMGEVPHAVIFAAAASRVKEALGGAYVPYGEAHGVYARMGEVAKVVNEVWAKRLPPEETVREIVERTVHKGN